MGSARGGADNPRGTAMRRGPRCGGTRSRGRDGGPSTRRARYRPRPAERGRAAAGLLGVERPASVGAREGWAFPPAGAPTPPCVPFPARRSF